MKSLDQIKNEYAINKRFSSWKHFCFVANDSMFIKAIDEIALLYAEYTSSYSLIQTYPEKLPVSDEILSERFG